MGERAESNGTMSRAIRESGSGHTVLCPGAEPDDKCQARFPLPGSGAKVQSTQMQNAKIPAILAGIPCRCIEGTGRQMWMAPMQLVTPSVVIMAVRMLMISCSMNFQVSLVIAVIGYSYFSNTNQHEYTRIIF